LLLQKEGFGLGKDSRSLFNKRILSLWFLPEVQLGSKKRDWIIKREREREGKKEKEP